jgi:hypothetical protein
MRSAAAASTLGERLRLFAAPGTKALTEFARSLIEEAFEPTAGGKAGP